MSDGLFGRSGGGLAGGLSGGLKMAAVALLIQQLMKHSRSGEAGTATPATPETRSGGGIGDILGGLLGGGGAGQSQGGGGLGGGGLGGGVLGGLLGGLGGLLGGLRAQGLDHKVESWVRPGANESVSADELSRAFDPKDVEEAARQAGTDRDGMMQEVSRVLPEMVDRMTPEGRLPQREEELGGGGLGGLLGSLLGQSPRR